MPRNNRNRRGALPKQGAGGAGYQGGRGCAPQTQQGGRGGGDDGGGRGRGGVPQHQQQQQPQHYGSPPEYQGRGGGPSSGGPASRAPKPSPADLIQQLLQSSVEQNKGIPRPPGKATAGRKCTVKANHFFAELPYKDLHQYDVTITPEVTLRRVNYDVMKQLVKLYRVSELGNRLPAYDGLKNLYTAGPLPFASKEFNITLDDEDGSGGQRCRGDREFLVEIKSVDAPADLRYLGLFLVGRQADPPQEALQAFNMALREVPTSRYGNMGPSFYPPMFGLKQDLGGGLESWQGFHQSIRPTQMGLSLNIDVSTTAFIAPQPVIKFVTKLLNWDISASSLSASSLSVADCKKIENALRGVKVEATHYEDMHIKYRISGLTDLPTERVTFPLDAKGKLISVVDYFRDKYDMKIKLTQWPCFKVGNQLRPKYLPMEVCQIVEGQRYNNMLNESQTTAIVNSSLQCPKEREKDILQTVHNNAYHDDPYVKEFGMKISDELASVEARILSAPSLRYRDDRGTAMDFQPEVGRWNMKHKKLYNGGRVDNWICIIFSEDVSVWMARRFCYSLAAMCKAKGMFAPEPLLHHVTAEPEQVERALKDLYLDAMAKLQPQGKKLDLLIVILPDIKGSLYGDLKRICETDLGLVSQCCLSKHVFQMEKAYLENMSLKINVKVGGQNTVLVDALSECLPLVGNLPTIFFGADVTHPHPGDKSNPSIAAVVASQDWPDMTKYAGLVCAQAHRQELIEDLYKTCEDPVRGLVGGGMIKELLDSFHNSTGLWPSRIIFYRDGVGEGQFGQVLDNELRAIYKACASISDDYIPLVTFVVVQKRHHTKLFANNHGDRSTVDCGGNILPGTVVDSTICHPTNFDFYLCSHSTPKGTSRPAHYHVLWDTNKFTADALQLLTNHLCYTFARCTQSVSIVPPVYYAHLLAARARFYVEPKTVGGPSVNAAVRPLSALKENVKRVMFYC